MRPATILVVDDNQAGARLLADRLQAAGYQALQAHGGLQALALAESAAPDLLLLDVLMPDLDGFEVCRRLRAKPRFAAMPVVMVTALDASSERVRGLDAGADDFISKPIVRDELLARVRSLLRVKQLYDEVSRQRAELERWSATLEQRVQDKIGEIERLSRLKRFFSPPLAERLLGEAGAEALASHRREVTVLMADLRGFTAFAEVAEPAVVMTLLRQFHSAMGELIFSCGGTLERFTGDGMMVFFNDPDPVPDHSQRAVRLALAMQARVQDLLPTWQVMGGPHGLGVGLARGVATLGAIGFDSRLDYAAIGSVTNLAARLCAEAPAGAVWACGAVHGAVLPAMHGELAARALGPLALKGFAQPMPAWCLAG